MMIIRYIKLLRNGECYIYCLCTSSIIINLFILREGAGEMGERGKFFSHNILISNLLKAVQEFFNNSLVGSPGGGGPCQCPSSSSPSLSSSSSSSASSSSSSSSSSLSPSSSNGQGTNVPSYRPDPTFDTVSQQISSHLSQPSQLLHGL